MTTALTIILVLVGLAMTATVLLQSGSAAGLSGSIAGGAETFFGKKKGMDELLSKITKWLAIGFLVISLIIVILQ